MKNRTLVFLEFTEKMISIDKISNFGHKVSTSTSNTNSRKEILISKVIRVANKTFIFGDIFKKQG